MIQSGSLEKASASDQGGGDGGPEGGSCGVSSADGSAGRTGWAREGGVIGSKNARAGTGETIGAGGEHHWWPPLRCNGTSLQRWH
jgi:hypothetical protein